ncbi:hypothetical protein NBRC10512_005528 [Rhodotorula toruloides]|uniref:RHTO0S09e03400g1_1 n=2 Tax=Rhodotorula toruloides TaxID=5286 RepID=A0A061BBS9_RHOTO|nr:putative stress response protein Rds1p [Rhodotorula toruloides NP11]EMS22912.1 putative stress response protein Rds1p [Rhodotorula toruloides NP11]KAJ8292740.1 Protein rds1 [Rhodotorula toruloides]CDR44389.1 RHTO0S09e03400g1_1 [Rhodotorula toruloides]
MRTTFFALAALAAGASSALASPESHQGMVKVAKRANAPTDTEILNYALTLEYLERNFYADVLKKFSATDFKKAGYAPRVRERFQALAKQEASHVQFLEAALGTNAVSDCSYIFGLTSVKAVVSTARLLENIGVSAYLGAAGDIQSKEYLAAAGSILTVEARHASYLNEINGASGFPDAYDSPLDYAQVYSLAAPIIIPNTCGKAAPLPASIQKFPALALKTKTPRAGHTSAFSFAPKQGYSGDYYVAFIADGQTQYSKVGAEQTAHIPKGLTGLVFAIVTTSPNALTDANTVAGPAPIFLA